MKKINVVIVGIGHDHAHDAFLCITKEDSPFHLLGIVLDEMDNGNYQKWQFDYDQFPHLSIEEALELQNLDAAIIESDDTKLTQNAIVFAENGINVHMDKPGGQDKEEFAKLIDVCKKKHTCLHLGYMYRYNPSVKEAIRICQSGLIGEIYSVEAHMSINHPKEKRVWLSKFKGGMMNFLGCHLVDIISTIQGRPDSVIPYNSRSSSEVGEDLGFALLRYGNHVSSVTTSGVEFDGFSRRHITITAEKMTIDIAPTETFIDGKLSSVSLYKAPIIIEGVPIGKIIYGPVDRYEEMFHEFASICKGEIENPYTLEHEQLTHDILLAACGEFGKENTL